MKLSSTDPKPAEKQIITADENLVSLSELCKELSISVATGRNWVKLGKLIPAFERKKTLFFSKTYMEQIKSDIKNGKNTALKSRRNKKYISGSNIYHSYVTEHSVNLPIVQSVIDYIEDNTIQITDEMICVMIAECAIQLILNKLNGIKKTNCLSKYLCGNLPGNEYLFLVDNIIKDSAHIREILDTYSELFSFEYTYEEREDILGLLYLSLKNQGSRKATGTYYTPTKIVKKLCHYLFTMNEAANKNVLDPCCGTGNFILQLPADISCNHVYGNDIDSLSVKIARINYALKYKVSDAIIVYTHIMEKDYLFFDRERRYDYIIGNPPWGYDFSDIQKEKLKEKYISAKGANIESYDVFVEQTLENLNKGGVLSFVLPEAILNVKTHSPIRQLMLDGCSFQYIEFLGNAFDKVQCPCVILQMKVTGEKFHGIGLLVRDNHREFWIRTMRKFNAECLSFTMTDDEYRIIEKLNNLNNGTTLLGKSRFALGIVTGNNKRYISREKTDENEVVLKGSDLCKFRFIPSDHYIVFKPESFQQVAPAEYYRAKEKLLYRFICNQLVFAYDNKQTLSLNSSNILIPEIDGLDIKYIMAVLNSRTAQFYFKKQFNSVKILRSHIEQIPIPKAEKQVQNKIIDMVDSILKTSVEKVIRELYDSLDSEIADLYGLSYNEYQTIKSAVEGDNLFLF